MKIGFIGLGTMGRHMAANLSKAGHELVVHDVRREAAEAHLKAGARWADSPRAVAEAQRRGLHLAAGAEGRRGGRAGREDGLLAGLTAGKAFFDLVDELAHGRAQAPRGVQGARRRHARRPGQRRPEGRRVAASWRCGSAATRRPSRSTSRCSTPSATRRTTSARSAPARSPSSCTTAPATSCRPRWPRSSRWA